MSTKTTTQQYREWRESSRHKLPPVSASNRVSTDRWLKYELANVIATLKEHQELPRHLIGVRERGIIARLKTARGLLRDLIARNQQRRGFGPRKGDS